MNAVKNMQIREGPELDSWKAQRLVKCHSRVLSILLSDYRHDGGPRVMLCYGLGERDDETHLEYLNQSNFCPVRTSDAESEFSSFAAYHTLVRSKPRSIKYIIYTQAEQKTCIHIPSHILMPHHRPNSEPLIRPIYLSSSSPRQA